MPPFNPPQPGVHQFKIHESGAMNRDYVAKISRALDARIDFVHAGKVYGAPTAPGKKSNTFGALVPMPALIVTVSFTSTDNPVDVSYIRVWFQSEDAEGPNEMPPAWQGVPPHPDKMLWKHFQDVFFETERKMVRVWVPTDAAANQRLGALNPLLHATSM